MKGRGAEYKQNWKSVLCSLLLYSSRFLIAPLLLSRHWVFMSESCFLLAAKDGAPCIFGGMVYRSGQSFQSSCKYQCTCLDGAVGCVPLCSMDVRLPSPDCPYPRRVKLPGKCCEEWVCDEPKDKERTAVGPALAGERTCHHISLECCCSDLNCTDYFCHSVLITTLARFDS